MKQYQIVEIAEKNNNAGTKAVQDAAAIAEKAGFIPLYVKMCTTKPSIIAKLERQIGYWKDWNAVYSTIEQGAVVLLQNPFHNRQITREKILRKLKEEKKVKYISLVHDVEELRRFRYDEYYKHEFETMIELVDTFIVHNNKMADFFRVKDVPENKIVNLKIFDYLQKGDTCPKPEFAKQITIAGNLDTQKCAYIAQLQKLKLVDIQLYGSNFDEKMMQCDNIHYGGSFPPDEISQKLTKGFGLVWDGTSINGCQGDAGQYLRYNNPHKLSLYLSCGLPVVIWEGAAEAEFVKENGVGITTDSLLEFEKEVMSLSEAEYDRYAANVQKVASKLRRGQFLTDALDTAMKLVSK